MCTNFKLRPAKDGVVVVGRTMEFPVGLPWQLQVVAKGTQFASIMPEGRTWTSTFDINSGLIREIGPTGQPSDEVTGWSTIANLTGGRWCYRLRNDPTIYRVGVYMVGVTTTDFTSSCSQPLPETTVGGFVAHII